MSSPLFTTKQMKELKEDRRKIHLQTRKDAMVVVLPYVVNFYANKIRPNSQRMLDDLKYSNSTEAFTFNSYFFLKGYSRARLVDVCLKNPPGSIFGDILMTTRLVLMFDIWNHSDFRQCLLAELGLDPEHFEFKNHSQMLLGDELNVNDIDILEYANHVRLHYRHRPKKTESLGPSLDK